MVDPRGVGPVTLDRHKSEILVSDQFARNPIAHPVEFRCSVARFSEQHDPCVANAREQSIQSRGFNRFKRLAGCRNFPG